MFERNGQRLGSVYNGKPSRKKADPEPEASTDAEGTETPEAKADDAKAKTSKKS